jgi:hypothetical protein
MEAVGNLPRQPAAKHCTGYNISAYNPKDTLNFLWIKFVFNVRAQNEIRRINFGLLSTDVHEAF